MKPDLVHKLRTWKGKALTHVVLNEAADEIERSQGREELLRLALDAAHDEVKRLQAICEEAQNFIEHRSICSFSAEKMRDCSCGFTEIWAALTDAAYG